MSWHFNVNKREMPWKGESDPYKIWLSEIILQQTRVEQGWNYYEKFIDQYPTVFELAGASLDEVLSLWEGLGYYSRARNLHFSAKYVCEELAGNFPETYKGLLELKGVGPYTAAAIASFAYGLPIPVLDGNSLRVVSRVMGSDTPIDSSKGKKQIRVFLEKAIPEDKAAAFNQAIMDFGATICTPRTPACSSCPLRNICCAFKENRVNELPVKSKKNKRKKRYFHYFFIKNENELLIQKRTSKDIWKGLYQLPLYEADQGGRLDGEELKMIFNISEEAAVEYYKSQNQQLSHQDITGYFYGVDTQPKDKFASGSKWVPYRDLDQIAFPKLIRCFLEEKQLTLNME